MLTKADDYPIHQTPEPIAYSGTDRNFYDRYFFNGYGPEGEDFFALGFGIYPHLNIMDANFSFIDADGKQHALHASKVMHMERLDTTVGPITVEVVEPLEKLRIIVDDKDSGMKADLLFTRRMEAHEEPRFTRRNGPRTFMDLTRLTQNGSYEGFIEIQGKRIEITPQVHKGTRDRSWGVRTIGMNDPQPVVPSPDPQFYWLWAPLNFEDKFSLFHVNHDKAGEVWNANAVLGSTLGAGGSVTRFAKSRADMTYKSGTRHASSSTLYFGDNDEVKIELEQKFNFYMLGIGYTHPEWGHGHYKGELEVGYEVFDINTLDENLFHHLHVQAFCQATLNVEGQPSQRGCGVLEQLIIGPHAPSGFKEFMDVAK